MLRSLIYHWRTNLAVIAGVAISVAVLSGALLVGTSVRSSLRDLLYERLGRTEYVLSSDRFFTETLAPALSAGIDSKFAVECSPVIHVSGVVVDEATRMPVYDVDVYGIDERFWRFHGIEDERAPEDRTAQVGQALAEKLGLKVGSGILLRVEMRQGVPRELLFGRREDAGRTLRLSCGEIVPAGRLGEFALRPGQRAAYSLFVPLSRLQRDLAQRDRVNALLLAFGSSGGNIETIRDSVKKHFTLQDAGIVLRPVSGGSAISVESSRVLLDETVAEAALGAASECGMPASGIFTYLANSIRAGAHEIPYSLVTAADIWQGALADVREIGNLPIIRASADRNSIWLTEWAWRDIGGSPGQNVELDYYVWEDAGRLVTRTARFSLAGVVSLAGDVDAGLAPDFPGITQARSIGDWDPPFPLDLRRIRPKDEDFWNRYHATPKAFITLAKGQNLWQNRFGRFSAVRIKIPEGTGIETARQKITDGILRRLNPELTGLTLTAVRQRGLEASRGSTDLGEYFVYFSVFLIASALLLSALFFRLGIEHRAREIGTLQAVGFRLGIIRRIFFEEGAVLSFAGSLIGLAGAAGYGGLMLHGLRTWWAGASGTSRLFLQVSTKDLAIGAAAGVLASLAAVAWTLGSLRGASPRMLLAGGPGGTIHGSRGGRVLLVISLSALVVAALMLFASAFGKLPEVEGFFLAGILLLVSTLSMIAFYVKRGRLRTISGHGWRAIFHLGVRNATHRPGRSLLCVALIALATFVLVSMEAFKQHPDSVSLAPDSGTGGYPLLASSAIPVVVDPNSAEGRETLGISGPEMSPVTFVPFRMRPGDDASCLNLYAPQDPRILGAPHSFVEAARFSFQESLAATPEEKQNPWLLLESGQEGETVPAIGDANTINYILHLAVGRVLSVRGDRGTTVRLRLVGALRDSMLQGELLISEADFMRIFPDHEGYRFFLVDAPPSSVDALAGRLTERLSDWGLNVESSRQRLADFHKVENTYLSTFQSLGALGLVLGTAGLATVLLRNVLERRSELALLRAVGYRRKVLSAVILAENAALMITGLLCGAICALIAILPALHARGGRFPLAAASLVIMLVFVVGMTASLLAVIAASRSPLLDALRSE